MSDATKAVFLSYAREDTDAAKRIADALRAFGVEVWFDQSELRGGDQWDQKIRNQIKTCALFVPLVSAQTEERTEGYFRREWKLAVDRTHDMAGNRSFIVPVVVDETKEATANVPEEFMRYQWTRLTQGVPSPEFVAQVKRLLDAPTRPTAGARPAPVHSSTPAAPAAPRSSGIPVGLAAVVGVALLGGIAFLALRPATKESLASTSPKSVAETKAAAPSPAASSPAPAGVAAPIDSKSIAVLPFVNMSGDKDSEYFSDGLTEEILNALARNPALRVAARTSSFAFKGKATAMDEIGRALHAASVIEGSVRKDGNRVRITIQLINAADGYHVWSETFTKEMTDIFALQDEIANKVAQKLGGAPVAPATAAATSDAAPTKNLAAYDAYLRGRAAQTTSTAERRVDAIRYYEEALRIDPRYALAWAQLGRICAEIFADGFDRSDEMAAKARAATDTALRLDPNLPEAHLALVSVRQSLDRDLAAAGRELDLAERLRANRAEVSAARADLAYANGQMGDALTTLVDRAVEADPQNGAMLNLLAGRLMAVGRFADAERLCDLAAKAGADVEETVRIRYTNLRLWTGDLDAALALVETLPDASRRQNRFYVYRAGLRERRGDLPGAIADYEQFRAIATAETFANRSGPRGVSVLSLYNIARIESRLGHAARATQLLDEAWVEFEKVIRDFPNLAGTATGRASVQARRGEAAAALAFMDERIRVATSTHVVPDILAARRNKATILAFIGRTDDAIAELRALQEAGWSFGYDLRTNPELESLRANPKFQQLMKESEARADAIPRPKK
jgi:TolB-like protein